MNKILSTSQIMRFLSLILLIVSTSANAVQSAKPYTVANRFNLSGQVTGTISPDPDGSGALKYHAARNSYNAQGLLYKVEQGELSAWQNETVAPVNWSGFTLHSTQEAYYDTQGNKIASAQKDDANNIQTFTQYSYDDYERLECQVVRLNVATFGNLTNDACVPTLSTEFGYDRVTKYTYDNIGQVLVVYKAYGTSLSQAYVTNDYYDSEGQPGLLKSMTDANGNTTTLEYDAYGRLEKREYPGSYGLDFNFYVYDLNSNLIEETKRNGAVFEYFYDDNNRMTHKRLVGSGTYSTDRINYTYDLRGLTLTTDAGGYNDRFLITNEFDGAGNVTSTETGRGYYGTDNARKLTYEYDLNGNRTKITHPDSKKFHYEFDGLDRVDRLTNNESTELLNLTYHSTGNRKKITRSGGATTNYNFDDISRLASFVQGFSGTSYDVTNSFGYNPASQVTDVTLSNSGYQYQGNQNKVGAYVSNNLNQYTQVNGQQLGYDDNGNLTSDGGTYTYVYDDENRLTSVAGADTAAFEYDPLGRLYEATVNNVTTQFLYDGDALVGEYTSSNTLLKRYVHGDRVDEPWVQFIGTGTSLSSSQFLHADHQGSVIAHSDTSSDVIATQAYDTYGIPASTNTGRFAYTGQTWFEALGLYHYKARFYQPKLGRFLQTDPIFYEDQMNMYAYVGNDPFNMVDPKGENTIAAMRISYRAGKSAGNAINNATRFITGASLSTHIADFAFDLIHNESSEESTETSNDQDSERKSEQREKRNKRRENSSRGEGGNKQNLSGTGSRTEGRKEANKGPKGKKPKGPDRSNNREKNRGIDEEHSVKPKSTGGNRH